LIFCRWSSARAEIASLRAALSKVLALAASAGVSLPVGEALEVIQAIAQEALRSNRTNR